MTNHRGVYLCYGDVPDDEAVQQIVALFSAWSANAFDVAFLDHVEDGARLAGVQAELRSRHRAQPSPNLFDVDRVRFVSNTEAAVRFRMTLLPHQTFDGRARRTAAGWKISRGTYCAVARLGGVACDDDEWDDDAS